MKLQQRPFRIVVVKCGLVLGIGRSDSACAGTFPHHRPDLVCVTLTTDATFAAVGKITGSEFASEWSDTNGRYLGEQCHDRQCFRAVA